MYETSSQPRDALACYVNAARGSKAKNHGKPVQPNLIQRAKFLQQQLDNAPFPASFNKFVPSKPILSNVFCIFFVPCTLRRNGHDISKDFA